MSEIESGDVKREGSDDEEPQLSEFALAALKEFLAEKNEREEQLRKIAEAAENDEKLLDEVQIEEDWVITIRPRAFITSWTTIY